MNGQSAKVRSTFKAYTTVVWRDGDDDREEFGSRGCPWMLLVVLSLEENADGQ